MDEFLEMNPAEFDQSPGGWRKYGEHGEEGKAVGLIESYIQSKKDLGGHECSLYFHLGQLYAGMGQNEKAIAAMKKSLNFVDDNTSRRLYIEANISFLAGDVSALREKLEEYSSQAIGDWKKNIPIIESFLKSLERGEKDYNKAYESA